MYIYVHHQFQWSNAAYSTVSAVYSVIGLVLLMVIVPISKKKNIGDPVLGIAGSVSLMFKNVGLGLANKVWIYHLGKNEFLRNILLFYFRDQLIAALFRSHLANFIY